MFFLPVDAEQAVVVPKWSDLYISNYAYDNLSFERLEEHYNNDIDFCTNNYIEKSELAGCYMKVKQHYENLIHSVSGMYMMRDKLDRIRRNIP